MLIYQLYVKTGSPSSTYGFLFLGTFDNTATFFYSSKNEVCRHREKHREGLVAQSVSTRFSLGAENERTDERQDGRTCLAKPKSQARRRAAKIHFSCSADYKQDCWQPCRLMLKANQGRPTSAAGVRGVTSTSTTVSSRTIYCATTS